MSEPFELFLFAHSPVVVEAAASAGIDGLVVDWEFRGKDERQRGADTEVNRQTLADLQQARSSTASTVICRVNGFGASTTREVDAAVDAGADELLLPMVRHPDDVARTLDLTRGRCGLGILVETLDAVRHAEALARLPLARVYVGLNDLAIERETPNLFAAVTDGMLDVVRQPFSLPFGFGGLTLPDGGQPVPCRLLIAEMARLRCTFSFLRRSFLRDVPVQNFGAATERIRTALTDARHRSEAEVLSDRKALAQAVAAWA